jgi:hypothetical protein
VHFTCIGAAPAGVTRLESWGQFHHPGARTRPADPLRCRPCPVPSCHWRIVAVVRLALSTFPAAQLPSATGSRDFARQPSHRHRGGPATSLVSHEHQSAATRPATLSSLLSCIPGRGVDSLPNNAIVTNMCCQPRIRSPGLGETTPSHTAHLQLTHESAMLSAAHHSHSLLSLSRTQHALPLHSFAPKTFRRLPVAQHRSAVRSLPSLP